MMSSANHTDQDLKLSGLDLNMVYLNPQGHNWGAENFDGYGISQIIFAAIYSIFFYAACFYVWLNRSHPILRMRKMNLALLSLLVLHVYVVMIFVVYMTNGSYPCGVVCDSLICHCKFVKRSGCDVLDPS